LTDDDLRPWLRDVPRQQLDDPVDGMLTDTDAGEKLPQVDFGLDAVELGGSDHYPRGARIPTIEHVGPLRTCDRAERSHLGEDRTIGFLLELRLDHRW
jgi:hypothetical protein